jgi:hypothetical protein
MHFSYMRILVLWCQAICIQLKLRANRHYTKSSSLYLGLKKYCCFRQPDRPKFLPADPKHLIEKLICLVFLVHILVILLVHDCFLRKKIINKKQCDRTTLFFSTMLPETTVFVLGLSRSSLRLCFSKPQYTFPATEVESIYQEVAF